MIFKLAFRNVISKKSSYVIIIFMAFAVALFCVANAVFDSTENGVQSNFISSFTGDLIIRPVSKSQLSLFGDETPVTGKLTRLENVVPYTEILEALSDAQEIKETVGQVTGTAVIEYGGQKNPVYLFGVNAPEYFQIMKSLRVIDGTFFERSQKGVMLSRFMAEKTKASVGKEVQFIVADGPYFRIRKGTVTGIYDYDVDNSIFERYILADPELVRDIMGIEDSLVVPDEEIEEEKMYLLDNDLDFDSLFDEASDTFAEYQDSDLQNSDFQDSELKKESENLEINQNPQVYSENYESRVWNFIICRLNDSVNSKKVIKNLNRTFRKNGWPVQATDWRHAAGSTALYLYWMRLIFNIGIAVVLVAGFIIVNNTLTVNVLDRTREIGTLRAIGAKKLFISAQCMVETFMMTITSGIIGTLMGMVITKIITNLHIMFTNSFLTQLFGSDALVVYVTPMNVLKMFVLVIVLGIIGWIYPVITALRVNPVKAMQGAK